ncbi:MAG TPA: hypothetical protein VII78_06440 [Myxococcota bacterium]
MLTTFSQFLLRHDLASMAELEEASQATVLYGGRLGSALIELGILTPEQLDAALARHHGLSEIPREWLARPDAGARAALHVDLIKRHRSFPLNFEKRSLHVGMVDPRDEQVLDNLAFASGCLVVPYALAEFRFVELMHRIYAVQPSHRFKTLLDEGNRARALRGREQQRKRATLEREQAESPLEFGPLAADIELSEHSSSFTVAESAASPQPAAPARAAAPIAPAEPVAPAPPTIPAPPVAATGPASRTPAPEIDTLPITLDRRAPTSSLEALECTIAESSDRARVIEASIELGRRFAEVVALFVIRDGVAAGLSAQHGEEPLDLDATLIPLAPESVLASCSASRQAARALPASALDKLLAKALRSDDKTELAVFPVAIGERVVNLLVAQAETGALGTTALAALGALAPQIGAAYQRLIRVQKQKAQVPALAAHDGSAAPAPKAAIGALQLQKRVVAAPAKKP